MSVSTPYKNIALVLTFIVKSLLKALIELSNKMAKCCEKIIVYGEICFKIVLNANEMYKNGMDSNF